MKKFKSAGFFLGMVCSFLAVCLFLFSCSTGLGESIDLEAPVLEITSPSHGTYVPGKFTLEGTATDNKKVTSVEVEYKYNENGEHKSGKKRAFLSGEKWYCDFEFDDDYEVEFEAYAYDAMKNGSDTSHQQIMLLIDSQAPDVGKMSIVRGDYVAKLYPLEEFTKINDGITARKDEPKNKDNFQNEELTLVTTLDDNYGIGEVSLDLYEVNLKTRSEMRIVEGIPAVKGISADSSGNKYSPRFTITEDMLPESIRNDGVHYIRPCLNVSDEAGNKHPFIDDGNVFAWESEYNRPHVFFSSMDGYVVKIQKDAPIIVTIFDDDKIKSCKYSTLKKEDSFTDEDFKDYSFEEGSRDLSFEIDTTDFNLGTYFMVMKVEDNTGRDDGVYYEEIKVNIIDESAPLIIVDKPEQNSVPVLNENGNFTIEGRVIDNETDLKKIAIVWLPNGTGDISSVETLFRDYDFSDDKSVTIGGTGTKIYKLEAKKLKTESGNTTYEFSKTFNFLTDFKKANGELHNDNKVFMIATEDPTGNLVTSTFRLSKISSAPKFEVGYKNDKEDVKPAENFMFTPLANQETTFTIRPRSDSNLKIRKFSVNGSDNDKTVNESNDSGDGITITFEKGEANLGKVYKYTLYAKDQIGGTSSESLTIQFDLFGVLQSITCDRPKDTIFVKGDTIRLQANFDNKVYVNATKGTPYIPIKGTLRGGATEKIGEAEYKSGNNSNTLYFEYTVPADIEYENLTIGNIEINGAEFEGNIDTFKEEVNAKLYKIDSVAPYIIGMDPGMDGVVTKKNGSDSVAITFKFNEHVTVESGTVIIQRTDGWYIPPVIAEEVFLKIYNEKADDKDKITLCGTADLSGDARFYANTLMPKGPYMQYTNGIVEKKDTDTMVPDLTTKYVLAYQYDIGDTNKDGVVANLRDVLEKAGYHKTEIDVSGRMSNGNNITLEIKDSDFIGGLVNGVDYKIILKNFSVHDDAYNYYNITNNDNDGFQLNDKSYTFWVGPVATPVIRVNRTATNGINDNPFDGNDDDLKKYLPRDVKLEGIKTNTTNSSHAARTTFKIDCETPGATVKYGTRTIQTKNVTKSQIEGLTLDDGGRAKDEHTLLIDDISSGAFNGIATNDSAALTNGTSTPIVIGENNREFSEKIYIKAQATKTSIGNEVAIGKEGAFKTVIHYYLDYTTDGSGKSNGDWRSNDTKGDGSYPFYETRHEINKMIGNDDEIKTPLLISGSQVPEGTSYTAGWPLIQSGNPRSNYQIAYTGASGTDDYKHFYWVSWQILDKFTLQTYSVNFQDPANPNVTYGMYHYCKNKRYYGWLYYN